MKTLDELLKDAQDACALMTPEQHEAMLRAQAESWGRSCVEWPKSDFHWENGVKVYHSYEDYVND